MGPKKNKYRQILTYDLTSQHAKEAFEEELDIADEQEYRRVIGNAASSSSGIGARRTRGAFTARSPAYDPDSSAVQDLYELFGQSVERQVIDGVYHDCGYDFEASMDFLVELSAIAHAQKAQLQDISTQLERRDVSGALILATNFTHGMFLPQWC